MDDEAYGILPISEINAIKKDIADLKSKSAASNEVIDVLNRQTAVLENMLLLFQGAAESIKKEGEGPLGSKVDKLISQNEVIAESILNLIDMVKQMKEKEEREFKQIEDEVTMPPPTPPNPNMIRDVPRDLGLDMPPQMGQAPAPRMNVPRQPTMQQPPSGPMPMPGGKLKDFELPEQAPKKKKGGLFDIKFKK